MLKPAVLYKEDIQEAFKELYYTDDLFYETGSLANWSPNIKEEPEPRDMQFAIVDSDEYLLGYLSYNIDWYSSKVYNFGLISFDKGNAIIGVDLLHKMKKLISRFHRIEWRMIGGNPVEKHYDNFCKRYGGTKHVLKDCIKDRSGVYHDDVIYEIVTKN